ncbi:hypothetical protein DPMN_107230 [Dreissena polymorpha]|uniref:Uncharacterized protein n=1 Tax=Dreissena polymorpha TaxID=45954 RepID=A0A9D4K6P3_DREPO|nr:hypothetical protein DPMN_107230 [Dreissena polymorpha]
MTIFELVRDIYKIDAKNVTSRVKMTPPPWRQSFLPVQTIFELNRHIQEVHNLENYLPFGSHVFQAKVTISELIQDIIGTNLLSMFHEDRKINVASRVLTRKNAPPPGGHVF